MTADRDDSIRTATCLLPTAERVRMILTAIDQATILAEGVGLHMGAVQLYPASGSTGAIPEDVRAMSTGGRTYESGGQRCETVDMSPRCYVYATRPISTTERVEELQRQLAETRAQLRAAVADLATPETNPFTRIAEGEGGGGGPGGCVRYTAPALVGGALFSVLDLEKCIDRTGRIPEGHIGIENPETGEMRIVRMPTEAEDTPLDMETWRRVTTPTAENPVPCCICGAPSESHYTSDDIDASCAKHPAPPHPTAEDVPAVDIEGLLIEDLERRRGTDPDRARIEERSGDGWSGDVALAKSRRGLGDERRGGGA